MIILSVVAIVALVLGLVYYAFLMPRPIPADIKDIMNQLPRYYPDDFAETIEAARKEGSASLYTSMLPAEMGAELAARMQKLYGVTVNVYSAGAEAVITKLLAERETGTKTCDVLALGDPLAMDSFTKQGLITQYKAAESVSFSPERLDANDRLYQYAGISLGLAYNTAFINESDLPKSYMDLLNPQWKDKIVVPDPTLSGAALDWLLRVVQPSMKSTIGWNFIERLFEETNPLVVTSTTAAYNTLVSGERIIGLTTSNRVAAGAAAGKPVKFVTGLQQSAAIHIGAILADAPHPNAAKLVLECLLSEDFATRGLVPYAWYSFRNDAPSPLGLPLFSEAQKILMPLDVVWAAANRTSVVERWRTIVGG